ncbi:MAG: hypothetical protein ACOCPX_05395 [Halapricum sp.]
MEVSELDELLHDSRNNAAIGWLLIVLLAGTAVGIVVATGPLWSVFALGIVVLALIPPLAYRSPYVMLPWEVLLMAALPIVGLATGTDRLSGQFSVYFAIAAVALVISVELQSFTTIRYPPWFAVVLVVVATLASAGLWGLLQWGFDVYLGTSYITTNEELMYEWLYSALAGILAGVTFVLYFRRRRKSVDAMLEEIDDIQTEGDRS